MSRAARRKARQNRPSAPVAPRRERPASRPRLPRGFTAVATCLFLSGAASLMLEVVWTRLLRLVFGSTTLAVSTILVAYMLGLGLGGLVGGRVAARLRNGVRAYGLIEIGIGCYAALVPWLLGLLPFLNGWMLSALSFWTIVLGRFTAVLVVLLLPTILMGATLPILIAALARERATLASRVGLLYGVNTLGAVSGVFLSTFILFPTLGVGVTNLMAATLDLIVGGIAIAVLAVRFQVRAVPAATEGRVHPVAGLEAPALARWNPALLAYGVVGFTALVYEVCWTRTLSLVLGSSIYAFATMLAAFLTGIALGSLIARRWLHRVRSLLPVYALGLAALGALSWVALLLFQILPDLFLHAVGRFGLSPTTIVTTSVGLSMIVMLGPTLVLGGLFPLLTQAVASTQRDPSKTVGDVYFVNTLGSAFGSFAAGFFLIPTAGLRMTLVLCISVNFVVAAVVLAWQRQWRDRAQQLTCAGLLAIAALVLMFPPTWDQAGLTRGVYRDAIERLDVGINLLPLSGVELERVLYYRDGVNTTVSVHRTAGETSLRVNGKVDAGTGRDMSTQVLSGQIPMLFGSPAQHVLTIGLASGVTVGSVALHHPAQLDVVELESTMAEAAHFFDDYNNRPLEQPNVRLIADDARAFLAYTAERYDVIISEPSNPWITGAASLFTREFFHTVRLALRPGGRLLQWIQLYGLRPADLRTILAALHTQFPHIYAFAFELGVGDLLLMASETPLHRADLPTWETLSDVVRDDLRRVNTFSTADLWSLLRLTPDDVNELVRTTTGVNTDANMLVELHSPWALYDASTTSENWRMLAQRSTGIVPIAELEAAALDADMLGKLALSYVDVRHDGAMARQLIAAAQQRGASADALVAEARLEMGDGTDFNEAAGALLDRAVAEYPAAFSPRLYRAQRYHAAERHAETLSDADTALSIVPGDLRARYLRLQALSALNRSAEARAEAKALLTSPYVELQSQLWADASRTAAAIGEYDDGIREMLRYLEHEPYSPGEWESLSIMYEAVERSADAQAAHANAERAARNMVLFLHQSARRSLLSGATREAVDSLKAALALDATYEPARLDLRRLGVTMDDARSPLD